MNYLENNEMLSCEDNINERVGDQTLIYKPFFKNEIMKYLNMALMISISYVSFTSTLQFSVKFVGADISIDLFVGVFETGERLTLTRF